MHELDFCRIKRSKSLMQNSLWNHDAYPDLPDLEPQSRIELGRFTEPGVIRTIHLTLNIDGGNREELLRGIFLEVEYEACGYTSVNAPVGDFFCDSFAGESMHFAGLVMAKRPTNSLYCYAPMPFKREIEISLVNKTDKKVTGYGYVTAERIPKWESDLGYFHANWLDKTVRLPEDTVPLLNTRGAGHFFGCHLTAVSSCPHFRENQGICEGNDEFYIDRSDNPVCNYLGTEDFFGFSWNWRKLWYDNYSGTTYLSDKDGTTKLACYRFLLNDPVRFSECLKVQINYRNEVNNKPLKKAKEEGNGDVRFGIVSYWYQNAPVDANSV
jgi:hypothetical protein